MKISTLLFFITSVPSKDDNQSTFLEDVSLLSFPEIMEYLDAEEETIRDSVVSEILAKSKA